MHPPHSKMATVPQWDALEQVVVKEAREWIASWKTLAEGKEEVARVA